MCKIKRSNSEGMAGIYMIVSMVNLKLYVGSSKDIYNRKKQHLYEIRHKKHGNKYLQDSFNKYGEENFEFYVIEFCKKKHLFEREQFYVNLYKSNYKQCGFNLKAVKLGNLGYSFTPEQRKKVSDGVKRKLQNINYKNKRTESILKYFRSEKGRNQRKKLTTESWKITL